MNGERWRWTGLGTRVEVVLEGLDSPFWVIMNVVRSSGFAPLSYYLAVDC